MTLAQRVKAKYPQYASVPDAELERRVIAKYPQYAQTSKAEARSNSKNWLTNDAKSLGGKVFNAVTNVLSLPSYAIGGILDSTQDGLQLGDLNVIRSGYRGVRDKKAVMQELPETFGLDPNSLPGMALGFAGELITPGVPVGKMANLFRGAKAVDRVVDAGNVFSRTAAKFGTGMEEVGKSLPLRALRPSPSQQRKFIEATGTTMGDFLAKNTNLIGSAEDAARKVEEIIEPLQKHYNSLARSGKPVDAYEYGLALLDKADEIERVDFSLEAKKVAERLREQAEHFVTRSDKSGGSIPINVLTNTKSSAYGKAGGALLDPTALNAQREAGNVGVDVISKYAPETRPLGRQLRDLRKFQEIAEQQGGLGKGTLPFSPLLASGGGAIAGYSSGETFGEKVRNAGAGFLLGKAVMSPSVISGASRGFSFAGRGIKSSAPTIGKVGKIASDVVKKSASTAARVSPGVGFTRTRTRESAPMPMPQQSPKTQTYKASITPVSDSYQVKPTTPSKTQAEIAKIIAKQKMPSMPRSGGNAAFGKQKKVVRGNFY